MPVSGFDKLSTCAFISSAEAMTRAPGSTACLWSFTRPARGGPSQIRWRCGSYRWTSASLPPLPSGSQSPSRVPGGPLASLELGRGGAAGKCLLPAPPLPSHPPLVLCQEARGEPFLHHDQAGPPGCFWKQPLPAGLFSVPSGRPTACVPRAVCRVSSCGGLSVPGPHQCSLPPVGLSQRP